MSLIMIKSTPKSELQCSFRSKGWTGRSGKPAKLLFPVQKVDRKEQSEDRQIFKKVTGITPSEFPGK